MNKKKEILNYIFREKALGGCERCPEKDPDCLDFHHIDSKTKSFGLDRNCMSKSLQAVKDEIGKCIMICANFHRKLHACERRNSLKILKNFEAIQKLHQEAIASSGTPPLSPL